MKLKVWMATQDKDSAAYNLVSRTKKDLMTQIEKQCNKNDYNEIVHIEINYANAFDLFEICTGEGGSRRSTIGTVLKTIKL